MLPGSDWGDSDDKGIVLVDPRDGLLLSKLGFVPTGNGSGAIFFAER